VWGQYVEVPKPDEYPVTCEGEDLRFGVGSGPPRFPEPLSIAATARSHEIDSPARHAHGIRVHHHSLGDELRT
jgi:hypothetical protein